MTTHTGQVVSRLKRSLSRNRSPGSTTPGSTPTESSELAVTPVPEVPQSSAVPPTSASQHQAATLTQTSEIALTPVFEELRSAAPPAVETSELESVTPIKSSEVAATPVPEKLSAAPSASALTPPATPIQSSEIELSAVTSASVATPSTPIESSEAASSPVLEKLHSVALPPAETSVPESATSIQSSEISATPAIEEPQSAAAVVSASVPESVEVTPTTADAPVEVCLLSLGSMGVPGQCRSCIWSHMEVYRGIS